jgi:hypothetical protein
VPTTYPKCSPTEMQGLLVLLNSHKGSEDVALLADDLDLEIDEILPSLDFASALGLVKVHDGRATFTDLGKRYVAATIRERKAILREQLLRTTLFKTLLRALDNAPEHQLTDEQLTHLFSVTPAPADESVQNIVNWGRYTELIRYDAVQHLLTPVRRAPSAGRTLTVNRPPPPTAPPESHPTSGPSNRKASGPSGPGEHTSPLPAMASA